MTPARHKFFWVPNAMTFGRIAVIPVLMWSILAIGHTMDSVFNAPVLLLFLFIASAITDALDGFFARRWDLVSDFGRMIDPIADKLLVAGCFIALMMVYGPSWFILIPATAIIFRDIFISGTREHAANANIVLSPTTLAKWKTSIEMVAIGTLIVNISMRTSHPFLDGIPNLLSISTYLGIGSLWLAAILSIYTGLHYVKDAFRR